MREYRVKQQSDFGIDYPIKRETAPKNFLKLFYPFHYSVGMAVEKHLSGPDLTRHQTVILWIIHSKGEGGHTIHRKTIERLIGEWYELGSPAISKVLRAMADKNLNLISIKESRTSAREKVIRLTKKGQATVNDMMERTEAFIRLIADELTDEEISKGMEFMSRVGAIVESGLDQQK
jgi:DNA-binding PadR family transcriptional regulator|tara:strand:- start:5836 stop:6366 length:531 start_codon:yes stop_codon:yes gene_type:complete